MPSELSDQEKIRRLPWFYGHSATNSVFTSLTFFGPVFVLFLGELGLPKALKERGNEVADHWEAKERGASADEIARIRRLHPASDVFLTSTNALTEAGELVNIDGAGQRVAAMICAAVPEAT